MVARIAIATPHARYAGMIARLRQRPGTELMAITSREGLDPAALAAFDPDFVFFPHWSWKIPAQIHERFECVIFHMADVPYGRGGSPLQNLIRRGHTETKLAALRCVAEMDAGPVYLKRPLALSGTAEEIFLRAADLMEEMIEEMIETRPQPVEQSGEPVIFRRLRPEDGDLAASASLRQAFDMIRMLDADGYPPAFVRAGGYRFEFSRASLKPGEIVADVRIRADEEGSR